MTAAELFLLVASAVQTAPFEDQASRTDRLPLLVIARDYGDVKVTQVNQGGSSRNGATYWVGARHTERNVDLSIWLNSKRIGRLRLDHSLLQDLDLRTMRAGLRKVGGLHVLTVEMRFGKETRCFEDDDGRSFFLVNVAEDGRAELRQADVKSCKLVWQELGSRRLIR